MPWELWFGDRSLSSSYESSSGNEIMTATMELIGPKGPLSMGSVSLTGRDVLLRERYVAVDPGVTTGIVMVDLPGNWREMDLYSLLSGLFQSDSRANSEGRECRECYAGEVSGFESGQIDEIIRVGKRGFNGFDSVKSVIIEDFVLRLGTKDRSLLAPVRLAARLEDRLYCMNFKGSIVYQSPSDAKSIVTDERLKRWGLWHEGSPHIRDAWRHMVKFLRDNQ